MQRIHTVIVGGGQAGLATSYALQQHGIEHVILEKAAQAADPWRNQRWDSFALNSPNAYNVLPGMDYTGDDPDGLLPRQQVVQFFEDYIHKFRLPVQYGTCVTAVEPGPAGGWIVRTEAGDYHADNVVIATGLFQRPKGSPFAGGLTPKVHQLHSSQYRSPSALPAGAVLIVGSSQSGTQIAEDLHDAGRQVYLCVSGTGRAPRNYRGMEIFHLMKAIGFFDRTPDMLPSPRARLAGNPQVTNKRNGKPINLHRFAREGIRLLGRFVGAEGTRVLLAPDLHANLAKADQAEAEILQRIDDYIARQGIQAPVETMPGWRDGFDVEQVEQVDLAAEGITSILWAHGYGFDFEMVRVPVTDEYGLPVQTRGVTRYPGLYFIGLPWLYKFQSGLIGGVGEDAVYIGSHIASGGRV